MPDSCSEFDRHIMKKALFCALACVLMLCILSVSGIFADGEQSATTLYVAASGASGDGQKDTPISGFDQMIGYIGAADSPLTFCLNAGEYEINTPLTIVADHPITIISEGDATLRFTGEGSLSVCGAVTIQGFAITADDVQGPLLNIGQGNGTLFCDLDISEVDCDVFCLDGGVQDCRIERCDFHAIGGYCINIVGENVRKNDDKANKNIVITQCLFERYGGEQLHPAVNVLFAYNTEISHNEFCDASATALRVGSGLGSENSLTYKCKVLENVIHDLSTSYQDICAIYMDGVQNDSLIEGNVIYSIGGGAGSKRQVGIYMGDNASYITIERNLIFDCSGYGYWIYRGKDNQIKNNIFAFNRLGQLYLGNNVDLYMNGHYQHNVYLTDGAPIYLCMMSTVHFSDYDNIFWDIRAGDKIKLDVFDADLDVLNVAAAKKKGYLEKPTVADPLFVDADKRDFTVCSNSPCTKTGFIPWDYSTAGREGGTHFGSGSVWGAEGTPSVKVTNITSIIYYAAGGVALIGVILVVVLLGKRNKNKKQEQGSAAAAAPQSKAQLKSIEEMVEEIVRERKQQEVLRLQAESEAKLTDGSEAPTDTEGVTSDETPQVEQKDDRADHLQ